MAMSKNIISSFVCFFISLSVTHSITAGPAPLGWRSYTSYVDTSYHGSQSQALNAWLRAFGHLESDGGCGVNTGGAYAYATCPVAWKETGEPEGSAGVYLLCPQPGGNYISPDGVTCPLGDDEPDPNSNGGPGNCPAMAGNPIHTGTGNKAQSSEKIGSPYI